MKKRQFTLLAGLLLTTSYGFMTEASAEEVRSPETGLVTVYNESTPQEPSVSEGQEGSSDLTLETVPKETLEESSVQEENPQEPMAEAEPESLSMEAYEENLKDFKRISYQELTRILTPDGQDHLLYIGRPTCYYCRQNSPILRDFNNMTGNQVHYYNTDADQMDREARKALFDKLGIPGTPSVLRLQNGDIVSGYLGSAPDAQALYKAVFSSEGPAEAAPQPTVYEPSPERPLETNHQEEILPVGAEASSHKELEKQLEASQTSQPLLSQLKTFIQTLYQEIKLFVKSWLS